MIIKNINNLVYCIVFIALFISKFALSDLKNCKYNENICNKLNQVVGIKTPMMVASGTIIDDDFIVTNRHVVEDHKQLIIRYYNGEIKKAFPLTHNFPADLAILTLNKQKKIPTKLLKLNKINGMIRIIGFDQGRKSNRIYDKGKVIAYSDTNKYPQSRIHTDAKSLPGNSGGAVVDDIGNLVGILASGDGNINEIIPISLVNEVIKRTDLIHEDNFFKIGKKIRLCADNLEEAQYIQKNLDDKIKKNIDTYCWNSQNKQLIDQAGQTFGRLGDLNKARKFLEKSIKLDPSSPNSLISLAIVYHIQRDLEKEKPLILRLLKLTPENPQVLRLGVQVAGILKDKEMSENVLELMTKYNREALPLAKKFIENAFKSNQ
ncbi:MAG: hypothetical protein CBD59_04500 [Alphaproteobacteria bacterium TMED199]|nr:MAG: hypothetical protein CBD59_04500 [Alphaproteobacteria bacterium TMED199]|tara:strand:+ start:1765 stop:2892 length:1128 start_codon:yes stop_codon:yes gene_type:complete